MKKIGDIAGTFSDKNSEFLEANKETGFTGTVCKAEWFNTLQRELCGIVEGFGETLDENNDQQISDILLRHLPIKKPIVQCQPSDGGLFLPEILTKNNTLGIDSKQNGEIVIQSNQAFLFKGVWEINTSDYEEKNRTFTTLPNKIYHLRFTIDDGFILNDLTDTKYNPSALPETHTQFDSNYNDMLIARVMTNKQNAITINSLKNKHQLSTIWNTNVVQAKNNPTANITFYTIPPQGTLLLNWSKTPTLLSLFGISGFDLGSKSRTAGGTNDNSLGIIATRYEANYFDIHVGGSDGTAFHYLIKAN